MVLLVLGVRLNWKGALEAKRSLRTRIRNQFLRLRGLVYQPQVKIDLPLDMLDRVYRALPQPPPGCWVRSPEGDHDYAPWAALLNEDGGYGHWDAERVRREIVTELIAADAATLAFLGDKLVGCAHTCRIPTRRGKHGMGMYLYVRPDCRGAGVLSSIVTWRTCWYFVREGFDKVTAATDPWRHSALFLYLREGAHPIRDSLFSFWQWYKIERRLQPTLKRWRLKQSTGGRRERDAG